MGAVVALAVESGVGGVLVGGVVTDGLVTDGVVGDGVVGDGVVGVGEVGDGVVVDGLVGDESRAAGRVVSPRLVFVLRGGASFVTRVPARVLSFVLLGVGFCASAGAAASASASHAAPAVEVRMRMRPPLSETVTRP
jgi:hypothetical protein